MLGAVVSPSSICLPVGSGPCSDMTPGCASAAVADLRPVFSHADMSSRPMCRHFMLKGSCRYENNCAFYHPGVNGPPLP